MIKAVKGTVRNNIIKLYYNPPEWLGNLYAKTMKLEISRSRPPYGDVNTAVLFAYSYRSILSNVFNVLSIKPEYAPFTIIPAQILYEILSLLKMLKELKPQRILEIGTERGGTLFLFTYVAKKDATIISIDLPPGEYHFGYSYPYWKEKLYKSFGFYSQKIHLIRGDSHNLRTFKKVKEVLGNEGVDFLFIDGDHSYEGVKKDFEIYSPLVKNGGGGVIAFHDIVPHDRAHDPYGQVGVSRFWNEIKRRYRHLEIVKDWNQGWAGIGVLFLCI